MADLTHPKNKPPGSTHKGQPAWEPDRLQQFCNAISDLNIARKNTQIYPSDHEQVQRSVQKAFETLGQVLKDRAGFRLSMLKNGFMVDQQVLGSKNPAIKEFAQSIRQQGIISIDFQKELQKKELARFLELLTMDRSDPTTVSEDTAVQDGRHAVFDHIHLQFIDYSKVRVTEEEEIKRKGRARNPDTQWRALIATFTEKAIGQGKETLGQIYDPVYLAYLMNRSDKDITEAVKQYESFLSSLVSRNDSDQGTPGGRDERLSYFNLLIQELNPKLRQQFLAATFDQLTRQSCQEQTTRTIMGLGQEVFLQMLQYAKADGKEISPSLFKLIRKIGHLPATSGNRSKGESLDRNFSGRDFQALLNREDYEKYVDGEYDQLLIDASVIPSSLPVNGLPLDLETGLEDGPVNAHAALALLQLMAISGDLEGYRDWARQLALILTDLVDSGAYECLAQILEAVQEEQKKQDGDKKKIAALVAKRFSEPALVSSLVAGIEKAEGDYRSAGMALLAKIGEPAVLEILDAFETAVSQAQIQDRHKLLEPFGVAAAREAGRRVNDPRPAYVCQMLRVVRQQGNAEVAQDLRGLLDHEDADVRMETLAVLLKFNNPWGILRLREMLSKPWSEETALAMRMAGDCRVSEVQPMLINFATRSGSLAADFERRIAALQALGRIGDPACVPELEKIAKRRRLFARKSLRQLKQVMYESLGGYPFRDVEHLIMLGIKGKDETIRRTCRRLLRMHRSNAKGMQNQVKASTHAS